MNLHQFRFVQEAVRQNLNLTETAKALFTSQPGVSKAILELEGELGIDIFARHGKRLRRVTEPGQQVLQADRDDHARGRQPQAHRRRVLAAGRRHAVDRHHPQPGALLPARAGRPLAPALSRRSTSACTRARPSQVARMVLEEVADIGLATEALADVEGLVTLPCYDWQHAARDALRTIRWRCSTASRWKTWRRSRWCPTTLRSAAAPGSTRRLRRGSSSPTSCSRRSMPT